MNPYLDPEPKANPYLQQGSGNPYIDAPDSMGDQVRGVADSLATGVKRAVRDVDVLMAAADAAAATKAPTRPQSMRAREQAMADPRRLTSTIDPTGGFDFSRGEQRFGIPAKMDAIRAPNQIARDARSFDIARQTAELAARPRSQAMQEFDAIPQNDIPAILVAVAKNPVEIIANVAAESLPPSLLGVAGGPVGVGLSSAATEFASGLVDQANQAGYDFSDPKRVAAFFRDRSAFQKSVQTAASKAAVVGGFDALTAGLAGRFLSGAEGKGARSVAGATAKELGMQMAGGASGEAVGQVVSGQSVGAKDVLLEAIGELAGAPAEAVSNLRNEVKAATHQETPKVSTPIPPPDPNADLQIPGDSTPDLNINMDPANSPETPEGSPQPNLSTELTSSPEAAPAPEEPANPYLSLTSDQQHGTTSALENPVAPEAPATTPIVEEQGGVVAPPTPVPEPKASPQEEPQQPVEPKQPDPKPGPRRSKTRPVFGDVLDDLEAVGGLVSKSRARKMGLLERMGPEYDDAPEKLSSPLHNFIYGDGRGGRGSMTPDRALQALRESYTGKYGDWSVADLWSAVRGASDSRMKLDQRNREAARQIDEQAKQATEFSKAMEKEQGNMAVNAGELIVGETLEIDGEKVKVSGYDDETGHVILDDGSRFGRQRVSVGETLYVEQIQPPTGTNVESSNLGSDPFADQPPTPKPAGFFDAPESVQEQKARMARESEAQQKKRDRERMLEAQAKPLVGKAIDTTSDLFEPDKAEAPLFAQQPPRKTIEQRLESLKIDTAGKLFDATIGIPIAIYNAAIDLAILTVRAGKGAGVAIKAALDYVRQNYGKPFDEQALEQRIQQAITSPERKFGQQVLESTDVSGEVKQSLGNLRYERRANQDDNELARELIRSAGGPEPAIPLFRDRTIPDAVRGFIAQQIIKGLGQQEQVAALSDPKESSRLAEVAARFVDEDVLPATTSAGQFIQSFKAFAQLTPRGMLGVYRRTLDRASNGVRKRLGGVLGNVSDAMNDLNRQGLTDIGSDRTAQDATAEAIAETIRNSPETANAIRVVIAGELGSNPIVLEQARAAIRRAFAAKMPRGNPTTLWGRYVEAAVSSILKENPATSRAGRAPIDAFTRTIVQVLRDQAGSMNGRPGENVAGLTAAQRIATMFQNPEKVRQVWAAAVARLQEEHPNDPRLAKMASQPAAMFDQKLIRDAIREEMEAAELSLRDQVAGHYRALGDGQTLAQRIVDRVGLTGENASRLAKAIDDVWRTEIFRLRNDMDNRIRRVKAEPRLARAARSGVVDLTQTTDRELDDAIRSQLQRLRTSIGAVLKGHFTNYANQGKQLADSFIADSRIPEPAAKVLADKLQRRFSEILADRRRAVLTRVRAALPIAYRRKLPVDVIAEAASLGILTDQKVWEAVRDRLGLPKYSAKVAEEITKQANAMARLPEGFRRDEAAINLLNKIANESSASPADLAWAFWYANTLSGPFTHLVNALSNAQQLAAHVTFSAVRDPAGIWSMLGTLADGFRAGWDEAGNVMATGKVTGTRAFKLEASQPLERIGTQGWRAVLDKYKYVARAMSAADLLFYKPAEASRKQALARGIARREGLKGEALQRRVSEILHVPPGAMESAAAQAAAEGLEGRAARRRAREIIDQRLAEDLRQSARDYALRVTFNNEPFGVLGSIAKWLKPMLNEVPALRLVVPFVNVVANVTNEALAYFPPVGGARAIWGHAKGSLNGRPLDLSTEAGRADLFDAYAKAAVGLGAMTLLAALGAADLDKEDPAFAIYGSGPADRNRRRQLRETGWRPWTVKIGGRWISYADTPLAIALGVVGSYQDALRWKQMDQAAALDRVAVAMQAVPRIILQRSFLASLSDFFVGLSRESAPSKSAERVAVAAARAGTAFVVPNLLRQVDRLMDPTVTDQSTIAGALVSQVPFVRRTGRPALNILGEPVISSPADRFTTAERGDSIWRTLAEKQAWPSAPDQRDLTDDQFYELTRVRGEWLRGQLKRLEPQLLAAAPPVAQAIVRRLSEMGTRYGRARVAAPTEPVLRP